MENLSDVEVPPLSSLNDPAGVKGEVVAMEPRIAGLIEKARSIEVRDDASQQLATTTLASMKQVWDQLEASRSERSGPFDKAAKAINRVYRIIQNPLSTEINALKDRLGSYVLRRADENEAALARQREAEQKAQRAASAAAKKAGLPPPVIVPKEAPPPVPTHLDTGAGATTVSRDWAVELVDASKAFAAYPNLFEFSEQRALKMVRAGVTTIPGVRVFQKPRVSVKS